MPRLTVLRQQQHRSNHRQCCCEFCTLGSSLSVQLTNFDGNLSAAAQLCTGTGPGGGGTKYTALTGVNGSYNIPVVIGMGGAPTCTYQDTFTLSGGLVRENYNGTPALCDGGLHSTDTATQLTITVQLHDSAGEIAVAQVTIGTTPSETLFSYTDPTAANNKFPGDNLSSDSALILTGTQTLNP
jgi:hypothetical protein